MNEQWPTPSIPSRAQPSEAVVDEKKRSAPDIFYSPHDLKCGDNLDKYLCALGNSWACK